MRNPSGLLMLPAVDTLILSLYTSPSSLILLSYIIAQATYLTRCCCPMQVRDSHQRMEDASQRGEMPLDWRRINPRYPPYLPPAAVAAAAELAPNDDQS